MVGRASDLGLTARRNCCRRSSGGSLPESCERIGAGQAKACPTTATRVHAMVGRASACQRPLAGAFSGRLLLEIRDRTYEAVYSAHGDGLSPDELGVQPGLAIFEKHLNDFLKVSVEFVQTLSLTVCPGKAWNVAHKQASASATLHHRGVRFHMRPVLLG